VDERRDARDDLTKVEDRLQDLGVRVRGLVLDGPPAPTILHAAKAHAATLIAMTTHGRGGLARLLFGSVTEKVLRDSPIPLLIHRSFAAEGSPRAPSFDRILVPVAQDYLRIETYVKEFAALFRARVTLLHVGKRDVRSTEDMKLVAHDLEVAGIPAEIHERPGDPVREILAEAEEERAGLIAMTSRRRPLGSVARKVLRGSRTPLLLIRKC
jgi:nucleotide-binding universal stress UspA family protein